jgi:hypothetical protein
MQRREVKLGMRVKNRKGNSGTIINTIHLDLGVVSIQWDKPLDNAIYNSTILVSQLTPIQTRKSNGRQII